MNEITAICPLSDEQAAALLSASTLRELQESILEVPLSRRDRETLRVAEKDRHPDSRDHPKRWRVGATRPDSVRALAAVAAALVVAALVVVVRGAPAPSRAAVALRRVADIAQAQPRSFPADRQFSYTKTLTVTRTVIRRDPGAFLPRRQILSKASSVTVTTEEQVWVSAERIGRARSHVVSLRFSDPAARRLWIRDGRPSFAPPGGSGPVPPISRDRYQLGNITLTRRQLLQTNTNPRRLYDKLYAAGKSPREVFTEITDTLRDRPAPPQLRAALFRVLALVPGIQLIGPVHDHLGRTGTAFAMPSGAVKSEVIIDPTTSQTLEERTIATPGHHQRLPAGTVLSTTTYLQRAITNTTQAPKPRPLQAPQLLERPTPRNSGFARLPPSRMLPFTSQYVPLQRMDCDGSGSRLMG